MDKPLPCLAVSRVTLCRVAFGYWLWLWPLLCPEVVGSKFKMEFLHCTWFVSVPCRVVSCRIGENLLVNFSVSYRVSYLSVSRRAVPDTSCWSGVTCRVMSALLPGRAASCPPYFSVSATSVPC